MAESSSTEIAKDVPPFFRLYRDGRVERFQPTDFVPPSQDPAAPVSSKDVTISPENKVSARLFLPKTAATSTQKLPLLIYIHGGAFCIQSAFSSSYHNYLTHLVSEANIVAVSVEYRLAPEHPIPACYEDSWDVFKRVISSAGKQSQSQAPEPWLRDHADFSQIFFAGDSAGANIANHLMVRASSGGEFPDGVKLAGMVLIHPFFGDGQPDAIWESVCGGEAPGVDDPRLNPAAHPEVLSKLVCMKIGVFTAEQDPLKQRGWAYYEAVKKSGWGGDVKITETKGESHVFHLFKPASENSAIFMKQVASFFH